MESKQALLDLLTAHIGLYHSSTSHASKNPKPNPRKAILSWFSALSVRQRQSFLTILDPGFVAVLLQMQSRLRTTGHGFFFLLPDIPSTSDLSLPTLCFRRSRGLLKRCSDSNAAERSIFEAVRMFGSREGVEKIRECALDAVTVSEDFVRDVDGFVAVMDGVSGGDFLRGDVDELGSVWMELPWLKDKGYYSLESFVANRLELALRLSWVNCNGGKKQRRVKSKEKNDISGVAANAFWRKSGCTDWFLGLNPAIRKKMWVTFSSKGAIPLAAEIFKSPNGFMKDIVPFYKAQSRKLQSCDSVLTCPSEDQLFYRTDTESVFCSISDSFSCRNSTLARHLKGLLVIWQIASMLTTCQIYELPVETLFFSTLSSVHMNSDHILRRFRVFLMVLSTDLLEIELTAGTSVNSFVKKSEDNAICSKKGKNKCHSSKRVNSSEVSGKSRLKSKNPSKDFEVGDLCRDQTHGKLSNCFLKDHCCKSYHDEKHTLKSRGIVKSEYNEESVNPKVHIKKKCGRKGPKKSCSSRETKDHIFVLPRGGNGSSSAVVQSEEMTFLSQSCEVSSISNDTTDSVDLQPLLSSCVAHTKFFLKPDNEVKKGTSYPTACALPSGVSHYQSSSILESKGTLELTSVRHARDEGIPKKCAALSPSEERAFSLTSVAEACAITVKDTLKDTGHEITLTVKSVCNSAMNCAASVFDSDSKVCTEFVMDGSKDSNTRSEKENDFCHANNQSISGGGMSYEWPTVAPFHFLPYGSNNLPGITDRLHLDAGHNWPNHFHQSFISARNQLRNTRIDHGCGHIPSLISPPSLDWPPAVRNCSRLGQSGSLNYDSIYNSNCSTQSSFCAGIANHGVQFRGSCSDDEWKYPGHVVDLSDFKGTTDLFDDAESHWMSEEESDMLAVSGRDYNKFFGGGAMYWNTSDQVGTGFSRPPSHSSEDSSWAWHEADLNRAIDDILGMPGLPAAFNTNGLASPPSSPFCSGPGPQPFGYVASGNEINVNGQDIQSPVADILEDNVPGSSNTSAGGADGMKDQLPYPGLRPIIIPSVSRKYTRSEFKINHEHMSPCIPSTRREHPRIKRPPSPVVLCGPRAPRVPPPSHVGESRKQRGFPVVRSGSSSPRNWGMKNCSLEEVNSEKGEVLMDGPEVVWAPWRNKGLSGNTIMQPMPGSLPQDRFLPLSQLARDQEHPDVTFPLQPSDLVNCSFQKTSLSMLHSLLHEEMNFFCQQVSTENYTKKPYINWAVKRVARSLQVLWPRSRTNVYGSNATGLALPSSDVDLVVCLPPVRNLEPIKEAGILEGRNGIKETCLQHAARYLANQEWVKNDSLKTIENTAIPLIMLVAEVPIDLVSICGTASFSQVDSAMTCKGAANISQCDPYNAENVSTSDCTNTEKNGHSNVRAIRLDISFKSPSHTGLQTTELVRVLTEQFPASVPLALVLKQFLADRSLDHSYSGGLSSYCLVLLITRFLQHEHHIGRSLNQNLGSLLMDFLYFFGNVFDPRQMRVSIHGTGLYINRERGQSIDPIHIDDPLCPTNNVGRNCFRIHQCIKAFADAYSILESELTSFSSGCDSTTLMSKELLSKIIPSFHCQK